MKSKITPIKFTDDERNALLKVAGLLGTKSVSDTVRHWMYRSFPDIFPKPRTWKDKEAE